MKRFFLFLLFVFLMVSSCQKPAVEDKPQPELKVERTSLTLSGNITPTDTIKVQSNQDWTVAVAPATAAAWLQLSTLTGSGNGDIIVRTTQNNTAAARSATITITATSGSIQPLNITVTQNPLQPQLTIDSTHLGLGAAKDSKDSFNIQSNISWQITSSTSWLTVNRSSDSNNAKVYVTALEANGSGAARTATLTIAPTGATIQPILLTVTQQATTAQTVTNVAVVWSKLYGGLSSEISYSMTASPYGGYVLAGKTASGDGDNSGTPLHGQYDGWL